MLVLLMFKFRRNSTHIIRTSKTSGLVLVTVATAPVRPGVKGEGVVGLSGSQPKK